MRVIGVTALARGNRDAITRLAQPLQILSKEGEYSYDIHYGKWPNLPDEPAILQTYRVRFGAKKDAEGVQAGEFGILGAAYEEKLRNGWLWVHDVSGDQGGFDENERLAVSGAHLVLVPDDWCYEMASEWNENVVKVANQIGLMPPREMIKSEGPFTRVLAVLSGDGDSQRGHWGDGLNYVRDTLYEHADRIEVITVNDEHLHHYANEELNIKTMAAPTYQDYLKLLDHADIALLPYSGVEGSVANLELRLLEYMTHGVVPIASKNLAQSVGLQDYVFLVEKDEDWAWRLNELLDEPEDILEIKLRNYDYVSQNRQWREHSFELDAAYRDATARFDELEAARRARLEG